MRRVVRVRALVKDVVKFCGAGAGEGTLFEGGGVLWEYEFSSMAVLMGEIVKWLVREQISVRARIKTRGSKALHPYSAVPCHPTYYAITTVCYNRVMLQHHAATC